ncbi:MAG: hypothetical protein ACK59C_02495 [Holosporales bacterium]|jgi:hypothetical protein
MVSTVAPPSLDLPSHQIYDRTQRYYKEKEPSLSQLKVEAREAEDKKLFPVMVGFPNGKFAIVSMTRDEQQYLQSKAAQEAYNKYLESEGRGPQSYSVFDSSAAANANDPNAELDIAPGVAELAGAVIGNASAVLVEAKIRALNEIVSKGGELTTVHLAALVETVDKMTVEQRGKLSENVAKFVDTARNALTENAKEITAKTGVALGQSLFAATTSISDAGRKAMDAFLEFAGKQPVNTTEAPGEISPDALQVYIMLAQQRQNS